MKKRVRIASSKTHSQSNTHRDKSTPLRVKEPETNPRIAIAVYRHRHGQDFRAFHALADAQAWRRTIAENWWDAEVPHEPKPPVFDDVAADRYFEHVADRGESYAIQQALIE